MKWLVYFFAVIIGLAPTAWSAEPVPATSLRAVTAITNAQASQHKPVFFEATVTYYRPYATTLFVQDGDSSIYLHPATIHRLAPGDRIRVHGTMHESFRPYVDNAEITLVGRSPLPQPRQPTFDQMARAETDCKLVTVRAVIQSADLVPNLQAAVSTTELSILVDGGQAFASIDSDNPSRLKDLLDSEVEMTGVQSGIFDNKMQQTGILFHIQSLDQVKILKPAQVDPWSIPVTPMSRSLAGYRIRDLSDRQRIHGTITYYQPGVALVLQDGARSTWINTHTWSPLHVGAVADVIGFPALENGFLTFTRGEIHETSTQAPVTPSHFTWRDLALGGNYGHGHVFDLVSVEGQVVAQVRQATQDEYLLKSDDHLFSAFIRHPGSLFPVPLPPMREIPQGAHVRVTGICMVTDPNPFNGEVPFNILMRNADDIAVVARPPWLTVEHLILIAGLLLCVVIAIGVRGWILERRVRRRTSALAYLEQRRRRILEDISGSRPLPEIVEQITELVSYKLKGAPCWCEDVDGTLFGNRPTNPAKFRVLQVEVPSRSGPPLGTIYAAFDLHTKSNEEQMEAVSMGAGLASLAIGTRRLYADLIHRSEFDLLTDIQNRFSLERHLDTLIERARHSEGIFGIIYIDLDGFKQINDKYGHQVGDIYLQEAASRMKRQLRPTDILARLGGDEFAVLVPIAGTRAEVQHIAQRLDKCFRAPFTARRQVLHGSASIGIALYPEDATTRDDLLRAADHAMYEAKNARKAQQRIKAVPTASKLASIVNK